MRLYLTGPAGSGKSTAAEILRDVHGASVYRLSDMLRDRRHRRDRAWLQGYADRLREAFGPQALAQAAHLAAEQDAPSFAVIEGVRLPEEAEFLTEQGYTGVRVEAPGWLRHHRLLLRDRHGLSLDEALHPTERAAVPAHTVLHNDGSLGSLKEQIAALLTGLGQESATTITSRR